MVIVISGFNIFFKQRGKMISPQIKYDGTFVDDENLSLCKCLTIDWVNVEDLIKKYERLYEHTAMIKPEELRLGNILRRKSNGNICIVTARMLVEIEDNIRNDYDPISLTEELLLKCGFKSSDYEEKYNADDECANLFEYRLDIGIFYRDLICKPSQGWYCFIADSDMVKDSASVGTQKIYYLHQLQNLYFALTGKELEVKL